MVIAIDPDVQAAIEFMQRNLPAAKLVAVSRAVNDLAPILWGHHATPQDSFRAVALDEEPPISQSSDVGMLRAAT